MRIKPIIGIVAWMALLPATLCLAFKLLLLGSIGPMVPIVGVVSVLVLPILIVTAFPGIFIKSKWRTPAWAALLLAGLFLALLEVNVFMLLTYVFGIIDYQVM